MCLVISATIVALVFVEESGTSVSFMPSSWYSTRPLWMLFAFAGFVGSYFLLRSRDASQQSSTKGKPVMQRVTLYTRKGCHLCDEAWLALMNFQSELPAIEEVDIDTHPQLIERFGNCVPVVEIDGVVRFRGKVNEVLLRRLIDGTLQQD